MGWNPFNAFRLNYDENTIIRSAEALVALKLAGAGYNYVNLDDGWWLRRDAGGIEIRTNLFPSALLPDGTTSFRPLTDRMHAMGLKAGIYTDIGFNTCSQHWDKDSPNLPAGSVAQREVGLMDHGKQDGTAFFAKWGFDYVKVDACGVADYGPDQIDVRSGRYRAVPPLIVRGRPSASKPKELAALYGRFANSVRSVAGSSPIIAICAWGEADVNDWAGRYGQTWRTSSDIRATWTSMLHNFDSAAPRALFAGPGRWNDPDLLEIGNGEFDDSHLTEARAHMSMWAIIAAPLMLSYDLTRASPEIHKIAGNREVIAINQDPAGNQGVILSQEGDREVIVKQLAHREAKAVALINRGNQPQNIEVALTDLGFLPSANFRIRDVWTATEEQATGTIVRRTLAPHETALLVVQGTTIDANRMTPMEMPARIKVEEPGFKPVDRGGDRPWIAGRIGYHPDGRSITTNGEFDKQAIGVAAGSRLRIALSREFRKVRLTPAADGYEIYGDGKRVRALQMAGSHIELDVAAIENLDLIAPASASANDFVWGQVEFIL